MVAGLIQRYLSFKSTWWGVGKKHKSMCKWQGLLMQISCGIFEPHLRCYYSELGNTFSPAGGVVKTGCSGHQSRQRSPGHGASKSHRAAGMPKKRILWVHQTESGGSKEECPPCQVCHLQSPGRYQPSAGQQFLLVSNVAN